MESKHTQDKEFHFVPIPGEAIDLWWPRVEVLLEETPETWEPYYYLRDIYKQVVQGDLQLFLVLKEMQVEFAMLTRVVNYPKITVVNLLWCSGRNIDRFLPMAMESINTFAYHVSGCMIKLHGRAGWARLLKSFGYEIEQVVLNKTLPGCWPVKV